MINEVFVFGSNLAGRHGKGAALTAAKVFGAEYGVGVGRTGQAYAIPTKDVDLKTLTLKEIEPHVATFLKHARENPTVTFFLTPIGTGLAGHKKGDIWAMLKRHGVPGNVILASTWVNEA